MLHPLAQNMISSNREFRVYVFKVTVLRSNILRRKQLFLCLLSSELLRLFKKDKDLTSFLSVASESSGNEN
jgi:hypothetical protein